MMTEGSACRYLISQLSNFAWPVIVFKCAGGGLQPWNSDQRDELAHMLLFQLTLTEFRTQFCETYFHTAASGSAMITACQAGVSVSVYVSAPRYLIQGFQSTPS